MEQSNLNRSTTKEHTRTIIVRKHSDPTCKAILYKDEKQCCRLGGLDLNHFASWY